MQYVLNDAESVATKETPNFAVFGTQWIKGWNVLTDDNTPLQKEWKLTIGTLRLSWNGTKAILRQRTRGSGQSLSIGRRTFGQSLTSKQVEIQQNLITYNWDPSRLEFDDYEFKLPSGMKIHPVFHMSVLQPTKNSETSENIEAQDEEYKVERIQKPKLPRGI